MGHTSLMQQAAVENRQVVASIFVNPLQFGPGEDFERYPRNEDRDFSIAEAAGVDVMFAPSVEEMLPKSQTTIRVSGVSELYEGKTRPGHFDGVATIVYKLFQIVQPEIAYFGRKDLQQCAVIRAMVRDLILPVSLRICDTVREKDGLALSSRNLYLSSEDRERAPMLYHVISQIARRCASLPDIHDIRGPMEAELNSKYRDLESNGFKVDYLDIVDAESMQPAHARTAETFVIVAASLGSTRLIDNAPVSG